MEVTKKVPTIRFSGFDDEWKQLNLKQLSVFFTDGDWIESKDQSRSGVRLLQTGNVGVNRFINKGETRKWVSLETFDRLNCKELHEGDIIVSRLPEPAGRACIVPNLPYMCITSVDCTIIRVSEKYVNSFLVQFLATPKYFRVVNEFLAGGTRQRISRSNLSKIVLNLPEKPEQTKIGNYFKEMDELIRLQEHKHEKFVNLKKAMLDKMFPKEGADVPEIRFKGFTDKWEKKKLGEVAQIISGGTPSTSVKEYWNGSIHWFSPTEIGKSTYADCSLKKITLLGLESSSAKILPAFKTILFTSRAGIGDMAILRVDGATNQGFQSLIVNSDYDVYFVYSMGHLIKNQAVKNASGSTFLEISGKILARLKFQVPSLQEQQKIGAYFENLDNLISQSKEQINKYKNIKQALLQKMFV